MGTAEIAVNLADGDFAVTNSGPIAEGDSVAFTTTFVGSLDGSEIVLDFKLDDDDMFADGDLFDDAQVTVSAQAELDWDVLQGLGIDDNGSYDIRATGIYPNGSTAMATTTLVVTNTAPVVDLSGAASVLEGGTYVLTLGPAADDGDDTVTSYRIFWGDGDVEDVAALTPALGAQVTHEYRDGLATPTISVAVTDEDGTFLQASTLDVTVNNVAPSLIVAGANDAVEGADYRLDLSATDPGEDTIQRWIVDWGDGTPVDTVDGLADSTQPLALTHVFADDNPLERTITITAIDEDGLYMAEKKMVQVANAPPDLLNLTATGTDEGGFAILAGTIDDPGVLDSFTVTVEWGDGNAQTFDLEAGATTFETDHQYLDDGDFSISATVSDGTDESAPVGALVTVANVAPTLADVRVTAEGGLATLVGDTVAEEGELITLVGTIGDVGSNDTHTVDVDWGDGTMTPAEVDAARRTFTATHRYVDEGTGSYSIAVTATDEDDPSSEAMETTTVTVVNAAPIVTALDLTTTEIDENGMAMLTGSFVDAGTLDTHEVEIAWGDGNTDTVSLAFGERSFSRAHQYDDDSNTAPGGVYAIAATVTDNDGGAGSETVSVTVLDVPPTVTLSGAAIVDEGDTYTLSIGPVTDPGDDTVSQYIVNWGDGSSNTVAAAGDVTHIYDGDATPTITVVLVNEDGTFLNPGTLSLTVADVAPTIALSGAARVDEGDTYTLTLGAVTDPGDDTVSDYIVDWGDGMTDTFTTAGDVTHVYADGDDTPTIVVDLINEDGTFLDAGTLSLTVDDVDPTIALSGAESVLEGDTYTPTLGAVTDPGTDIVSDYVVNWGDGMTNTFDAAGEVDHVYADGDAAPTITVDHVNEDGTFLDAGRLSLTVDDVAPTIALLGAAVVDEGATYTLTLGAVTDPGEDIVNEYIIDWGDGSSNTFGAAGDVTHVYAEDRSAVTITVDLKNEDGTFLGAGEHSIAVSNVAPTVTLNQVTEVFENGVATLTGTISDPGTLDSLTLDIVWGDPLSPNNVQTINLDPSATGAQSFTLTHRYLDDNPSGQPVATYQIRATVRDDDGGAAEETTAVTVNNVAPSFVGAFNSSAAEVGAVLPGEVVTLVGGDFADIGIRDVLTVTIDWGDGTVDDAPLAVASGSLDGITHTYDDPGFFTIEATVADDDGGAVTATTDAKLTGVELGPDGVLRIAGTVDKDIVEIRKPREPIAYWSLNEDAGPLVEDTAGTQQDGIIVGTVGLASAGPTGFPAPFGAESAASFNGSTENYITVAHDPVFQLAEGTIQFWFNARSTIGNQTLFAKDHQGFGDGGHLNVALVGNHVEVRLQDNNASPKIRTGQIVQDGVWHHLAFTFGPAGQKLYLDGELVGEDTATIGLTMNQEAIVIGASNEANKASVPSPLKITQAFDGLIDEVAIYDVDVGADQVERLATRGPLAATNPKGLTIEVFADFLEDVGEPVIKNFVADDVKDILIFTGPGDDVVNIDATIDVDVAANGQGDADLLIAGSGPTLFFGGEGADTLVGGINDDMLFGEGGDDLLLGGGGNDTIDGGTGNDTIDGGTGLDTVAGIASAGLTGGLADYTFDFAAVPGAMTIAGPGTPDGTDEYRGVELITFADGTVGYVLGSGSENAPTLTVDQVDQLAGGGQLAVLGDSQQTLQLVGAWADLYDPLVIGGSTFSRFRSGTTTLLVLAGVTVTIDPSQPVAATTNAADGEASADDWLWLDADGNLVPLEMMQAWLSTHTAPTDETPVPDPVPDPVA